jgi:hypothetical protein
MIFSIKRRPRQFPFTVTALKQGHDPIRIGVIAPSPADALLTAQELFPDHVIGVATLEPEWLEEDPA